MTASAQTTQRQSDDARETALGGDLSRQIEGRVGEIASGCADQTEFLRRLATEFSNAFELDAVGVTHPEWETPMILMSGNVATSRIDGDGVIQILASATSAPTASNVPMWTTEGVEVDSRGLHVQLSNENGVSAVLLLYSPNRLPTSVEQVRDLKRLAQYAAYCRDALSDLPFSTPGQRSRSLSDPQTLSVGQNRTLRSFHRDLDLKGTAYRIVNESRRLLDADRVSLLIEKRGDFRMLAVSGVAVVDRRANAVKDAEHFANRVAVLDRPILLPGDEPLPPQIQDSLDDYLDESDVASVLVYPMHLPDDAMTEEAELDSHGETDGDTFAILLVESFSDRRFALHSTMREVAADASMALANSMQHDRIFALPLLRTLGDWFGGRRLRWSVLAVIALVALLIASLVVRVDHRVIATGYAEPSIQQHVYARSDGTVREIFVRDGERVAKGDRLARLENAELETRAETLSGQVQTTSERLASIASMLLDPATDERQVGRFAIEKRQLTSELEGLGQQLRLVQQQQDELIIKSPIDGVVAGWRLRRKLMDRPLRRGDRLLSVVDLEADWQLRLEVPEEDAAELIDAFDQRGSLEVVFAAKSNPRSSYAATLDSIATAARKTEAGASVVDAIALVTGNAATGGLHPFYSSQARTGVDATAKITCGRRTFLGSWFGDVADFVDRHLLFYVR